MEIKGASQTAFSVTTKGSEINDSQSSDRSTTENTSVINLQDVKTKAIREVDVKKAVDKLNVFLQDDKTHAEYEIHPIFKDVMIKIIDDKTGNVVLEIPPKRILDMIAKMCEMVGVMVDKKA